MSDDEYPESLGGEFNFQVGRWHYHEYQDDTHPRVPVTRYVVQLPHSCDEWVIDNTGSVEETAATLERFIGEAQAALAKLRSITQEGEPQ